MMPPLSSKPSADALELKQLSTPLSHQEKLTLLGAHTWSTSPSSARLVFAWLIDSSLLSLGGIGLIRIITHPWTGPLPLWLTPTQEAIGGFAAGILLAFGLQGLTYLSRSPFSLGWWLLDIRRDANSSQKKLKTLSTRGLSRQILQTLLAVTLLCASLGGLRHLVLKTGVRNRVSLELSQSQIKNSSRAQHQPELAPNETQWATYPLFTTLGHWPLQTAQGDPYLFTLPFSQRIPKQYLPYARIENPHREIRLEFRGPRPQTLPSQRSTKDALMDLIKDQRESFRATLPDTRLPPHWSANAPLVTALSAPGSAIIQLKAEELGHFFLSQRLLNTEQGLLTDLHWSGGLMSQEERTRLENALSNLVLQKEISSARAFINQEIAQVRLPKEGITTLSRTSDWNSLIRVEHLLGSKLTLDPGSLETWFHFGGINSWIREAALERELPEIARLAERNFMVSLQSLEHLAPKHPLTDELKKARAAIELRMKGKR